MIMVKCTMPVISIHVLSTFLPVSVTLKLRYNTIQCFECVETVLMLFSYVFHTERGAFGDNKNMNFVVW